MHTYHDTQHSPYTTQQLFDLVMDIERYPQFLPWCRASRIIERSETRVLGELVVVFKHITESYVSEVTFKRPQNPEDSGNIDVKLVRGPFNHLNNHWVFTPLPEGGCEIALTLSFQFRSRILDALIGLLFGKASAKMVASFKERADQLYAKKD